MEKRLTENMDKKFEENLIYIKEEFEMDATATEECNTELFESVTCDVKRDPCEIDYDSEENKAKIIESIIYIENHKQNNDIIIQEMSVSTDNIKNEPQEIDDLSVNQHLVCNICDIKYTDFCSGCTMLKHVLDNNAIFEGNDWTKETLPKNILEVKAADNCSGIFSLKVIPKDVIFGPFYGLEYIHNNTGILWKLNNGKLMTTLSAEALNWMKYVNSTKDVSKPNLIVVQSENRLYFQSTQQINIGEELVIFFNEDKIKTSENDIEAYDPTEQKLGKVYACTYCCLGFSSEVYLIKHKRKCSYIVDSDDPLEEIVPCVYCQIYLYTNEYEEYHMTYCREIHRRNVCNNQEEESTSIPDEIEKIFKCPGCNFDTKDKNSLEEHLSTHNNVKEFQCELCDFKTKYKRSLGRHATVHSNETPFECKLCGRKFGHNALLRQHTRKVHKIFDIRTYKCLRCPFEAEKRADLKQHVSSSHTDDPFKCDICNKRFATKPYLYVHMTRTHCSDKIEKPQIKKYESFKCDICQKVFSCKAYLYSHIKRTHATEDDMKFQCPNCTYKTNRKCNYDQHIKTHGAVKSFECTLCFKEFTLLEYLKVHMKNKHTNVEERKFKCQHCSYRSNYKHNIAYHVNVMHRERIFKCNDCEEEFPKNILLEKHMQKVHNAVLEKKYKCSECEFTTHLRYRLKQHALRHSNDKPFKCEICDIHFKRKEHLARHTINKHVDFDKNKYNCKKCNFSTKYETSIKFHEHIHENIKEFECKLCNQRYRRHENLKRHQIARHGGVSAKS